MRAVMFLMLSMLAASALAAEAYRWVGKDGTVHYEDRPAPGAKFIDVHPGSGNGPSKEQLSRAAECAKKKSELEAYESAAGINEVDDKGKSRAYSPEERRAFIETFQKSVEEACVPPKRSWTGAPG